MRPSSSSPEESSPESSQFPDDENVLVLTKTRFFQTLRILLDYAQHPERRTWEFFSYRPWDYILGTFCLTFDLYQFAISCGPQHPCFCERPLPSTHDGVRTARLEYAQPDFTLMSHAFGTEGELLFLGEVKPMGPVEPDTVDAFYEATAAFLQAETQRLRQAKLAFERHSESDTIKILMMSGSFWSVWSYRRSLFEESGEGETDNQSPPSPTGSDEHNAISPDRSPPHKIRRTDNTPPDEARSSILYRRSTRFNNRDRGISVTNDDLSGFSPVPSPLSNRKDPTWRSNPQEEPLDTDTEWDLLPPKRSKVAKKGKKGKKVPNARADTPVNSEIGVHHIFSLPNKDELNPWFRHFLKNTRDALIGDNAKRGSVQSSWFDWPRSEAPDDDGHAPGFVLPETKEPSENDEQPKIVELIRVDEPPEMPNVIGLPLSQVAANALMSPRLSLPTSSSRAGSNYTPGSSRTPAAFNRFGHFDVEEDTVLPQLPEAEYSKDDYETIPSPTDEHDTTLSPTAERPHLIRTPVQRQRSREPSLTDIYLTPKRRDLPQRQSDSAAPAEPPPPQSFEDSASHEDRHASAGTAGDGASTQTPNDRAPLVAPTPVVASPTVAGDYRARRSTTNFRTRIPGSTRATVSLSARKTSETRRRKLDKIWDLRYGPLLAKELPNGEDLPPGFADMSRADQELSFALLLPQHRGWEPARLAQEDEAVFRRTGLPPTQVQHMMAFTRGRRSVEQPDTAAPDLGPSTSRSGTRSGATVRRDPNSLAAVVPPPPPPTTTSLPRSANAQSSGLSRVSEEAAGPSTTTTGAASRTHAGSRARAVGGPGGASSSSRGASASLSVDNSSRSSGEPGSSQASNVPRPQRRRDPVASTTADMETLHLGGQPSGTDRGEGSSNRKRKDR